MKKMIFVLILYCCVGFIYSQSSEKSKARKSYLESVYGTDSISKEEMRKIKQDILQDRMMTLPISPTLGELGQTQTTYFDPRYDKYSYIITGHTQDPEAVYQRLEKERKIKLMKKIIPIIIFALVIAFLLWRRFKPSKSDRKVKEVSKYGDNTLTNDELHTAQILYELKEKVNDPQYKDLFDSFGERAIDEISLDIFKYGIWRLLDVKYANHLFSNKAYVEIGKQKMIADINKKFNDEEFLNMTKEEIDNYVLKWVLKTRDDAQGVKNIMSSLKTEK